MKTKYEVKKIFKKIKSVPKKISIMLCPSN